MSDESHGGIVKYCNFSSPSQSEECEKALGQADGEIGDIYPYDIYAPLCGSNSTSPSVRTSLSFSSSLKNLHWYRYSFMIIWSWIGNCSYLHSTPARRTMYSRTWTRLRCRKRFTPTPPDSPDRGRLAGILFRFFFFWIINYPLLSIEVIHASWYMYMQWPRLDRHAGYSPACDQGAHG